MLVYLPSVEERPFRAVFGYRTKLGFSPGEEFSRGYINSSIALVPSF